MTAKDLSERKAEVLGELIESLATGEATISGFEDEINDALDEAERLRTPWFAGEILAETIEKNQTMKEVVEAFVDAIARDSLG